MQSKRKFSKTKQRVYLMERNHCKAKKNYKTDQLWGIRIIRGSLFGEFKHLENKKVQKGNKTY